MSDFNPLVSIVIPVYNGSNYIREAIDSALAQTYENIEIVVVNDGSTDNTEEIVLSYGDKIRYFAKKNGGTSTALNMGIANMRGEYFSWLSHDDQYYPQKVARAIEELSKLEDKNTIIISELDGIDENYEKLYRSYYKEDRDDYPKRHQVPLYPVIYNRTHGCTHLISKKVFETVGLFDVKWLVAHDYEFYYRAFAKFPHLLIPEVLVNARESSNRQGRRSHTRGNIEYSLLFITIMESLGEQEILEIAPSVKNYLLDMEAFFSSAGYTVALEYLYLRAKLEGIHIKREKPSVSKVEEVAVEAEAEPAAPYIKRSYARRFVRGMRRYGFMGFWKVFFRKIKRKK